MVCGMRRFRLERSSGGPLLLDMTAPQPLGFLLQPLERPCRPQHGGVVLADRLPAVVGADAAVMHEADVVADGGARALEARPVIGAARMHGRRQDMRRCDGLSRMSSGLPAIASEERHGVDQFGELAQIDFDTGPVFADGDDPLEAALVIDGAGDADRLMGRTEVGIAADLEGDVAAQPAERGEIVAFGGFGELPPDVQLGARPPASGRRSRQSASGGRDAGRDGELGPDVAGVEIDHDGLHL